MASARVVDAQRHEVGEGRAQALEGVSGWNLVGEHGANVVVRVGCGEARGVEDLLKRTAHTTQIVQDRHLCQLDCHIALVAQLNDGHRLRRAPFAGRVFEEASGVSHRVAAHALRPVEMAQCHIVERPVDARFNVFRPADAHLRVACVGHPSAGGYKLV